MRAIAAPDSPNCRSTPRWYLSSKVIWRYVIAGVLRLAEIETHGIAGSPFSCGDVLHLVHECTLPSKRLTLSARWRRFGRNAQWKLSILCAAPAGRSVSATR
jgi:hypothetical protein